MSRARTLALWVSLLLAGAAHATTDFDGEFATFNDFGDVGLLQTPTARMQPDGTFGLGVSTVRPYNQIHLFLQPLPWLETAVRYTDVTNRFYGLSLTRQFGNQQHYKDKSIDFKIRLLREGEYWPALAVGVQDFGGTGIFSSEYLVGSYHYYDFDFSAGLGWGRLGAGGEIPNPLGAVSHHFRQSRTLTDQNSSSAGNFGLGRLFTGQKIGIFGGIEWHTPVPGLLAQIEYDANDYQHEGLGIRLPKDSPVNVGLEYQGIKGLHIGIGYERGNTVMARVDLSLNFQRYLGPEKFFDPPPTPVKPPPAAPAPSPAAATSSPSPAGAPVMPATAGASRPESSARGKSLARLTLAVRRGLAAQDLQLAALDEREATGDLRVWVENDRYRNPALFVGRVARVLADVAPPGIRRFTVIEVEGDAELFRAQVDREAFTRAATGRLSPAALAQHVDLEAPGDGYGRAQVIDDTRFPAFSWSTAPALRQSVGGPDAFYAVQLWWRLSGSVALTDRLSLTSTVGFNIYNNFDQLRYPSNSTLPHVRSDIAKYLRDGQNNLVQLEADYIWSPAPEWYSRVSAGIFEEMYGGVSTQTLYRPYGSRWAFGVDLNHVWQRTFTQRLRFFNYNVTTGSASVYYLIPGIDVLAHVSVGRYLARDYGGTVDLSRQFRDGVRAGVFATKTNVSAAQFGEGSFDKGIYLIIPFDLFSTESSRNYAGLAFRPLTRDGGQMPYDGPDLYYYTEDSQPRDFARGWADILH